MKLRLLSIVFATATLCAANDYVIVASSAVDLTDVSSADLKAVFMGTRNAIQGIELEPVLADGGAAHDAFLKQCIGKSDSAYRNQLTSLVFTGKMAMPRSLKTDADIVRYVAGRKGAIGYVSSSATGATVRTLAVR
jgi:hypothetical protein